MADGLPPIPCLIQDFCRGGFFLCFRSPAAGNSLPRQARVHIQFGAASGEKFRLASEIRHVQPGGVGVAVDFIPEAAFLALQMAAGQQPAPRFRSAREAPVDPSLRASCKTALLTVTAAQAPVMTERFFAAVGHALDHDEHALAFMNRSALEDMWATLKDYKAVFSGEFGKAVRLELEEWLSPPRLRQPSPEAPDLSALSLVEKEDFEDWLSLSAVAKRLSNHYEARLMRLRGQLNAVFDIFSESASPVSPEVFCDIFRSLIQPFGFANDFKKILYTVLEQVLLNGLEPLYDRLEDALLAHGAPDRITPAVVRRVERSGAKTDDSRAAVPESPDAAVTEPAAPRQPTLHAVNRLLDILKESEGRKTPQAEARRQPPAAGYYHTDEIVAALEELQHNARAYSVLHHNARALREQLQHILKASGQEQKAFAERDLDRLEMYGKLFESLLGDATISPDLKAHVENLHLPLLALALQGGDFLGQEHHPARSLLNQLALLETGIQNNRLIKGKPLRAAVGDVIDRVTREGVHNAQVFAEAEQKLSTLTEEVNRSVEVNIKRIVEVYEGQQKLEQSRRSVQHAIDGLIAGKTVPRIIPWLLMSGWQHLLVINELNDAKTEESKTACYDAINDLLRWLEAPAPILDAQSARIAETLAFINEQLASVCTNAFLCAKVVEELKLLLLGDPATGIRKKAEQQAIEPAPQADPRPSVGDDPALRQIEQLRLNEWLAVFTDPHNVNPMKLVWIGELPAIFVFVNKEGRQKWEFTRDELAALLRSGTASRIDSLDAPLMDRVTTMMLQQMHQKLIYNATHDPVTDLHNRDEFIKLLKQERAKPGADGHVLGHLEIQDFRMISNICGINGGNQLLKNLTRLLRETLKTDTLIARLGDKTFGLLVKNCTFDQAYALAKKLAALIAASHFEWQNQSYPVNASIGLTPFAVGDYDVHQLMQQADAAGISAERAGHNRVQMFAADDESLKHQVKLHEWAGQIDHILAEDRIFIRCQKIAPVAASDRGRSHYEILMGLRDRSGNIVAPDHFIPAAERCNRMPEIDRYIIKKVFAWIEANRLYFSQTDGFSINLSGQSINTEEFLDFLKTILASGSVQPDKLTFEITETVAVDSLLYVQKFIDEIKGFGCKFSLDDFGSGYSSYSYLKSLSVDYLKIDGAFVKDIAANEADAAIVKSMNEIAHLLGMKTIAEYVENDQILAILKTIGVDYVQGYGIQKPILLNQLTTLAD